MSLQVRVLVSIQSRTQTMPSGFEHFRVHITTMSNPFNHTRLICNLFSNYIASFLKISSMVFVNLLEISPTEQPVNTHID